MNELPVNEAIDAFFLVGGESKGLLDVINVKVWILSV
jgi:hypothetical protein